MSSALFEKLRQVRERYRAALPEALSEVSNALLEQTAESTARAHRRLHELCGTAGMIGEKDLALCLDPALRIAEDCAAEVRVPTPTEQTQIETAISAAQGV